MIFNPTCPILADLERMTKWYSRQEQEFAESRVRGERILAPIRKTIDADYGFLTLDEVASFVWDRIGERTSRTELKSHVLAAYDTKEAQVDRDLDELLT
ncbi:MAG: PqqD family protein, partial [Planctomycetaceae bacterium]|nr:PqqD family protein [Planctomycetaceae bacterium]